MFTMLLGAVVLAALFGNVAMLVANYNISKTRLMEKMEQAYCLLPTTHYLLPTTYCLLPTITTYYLLPATHYPLLTTETCYTYWLVEKMERAIGVGDRDGWDFHGWDAYTCRGLF